MSTAIWDTTGQKVVAALQAERRASGAVSLGLALTLVVVTTEQELPDVEDAVYVAANEHPSRVLLVVRRSFRAEDRLDAEVSVGERFGPGEAAVLRMSGRLSLHAESVVLPLLAPDAPVVTWLQSGTPELLAHDPLAVLASRRITDVAREDDPDAALKRRAEDYAPGDTDFAWTRTTRWRALLATAFDQPLPRVQEGHVRAASETPSAMLLAGWLRARLDVPVDVTEWEGAAPLMGVELALEDGTTLEVQRHDEGRAVLRRPGQPERLMPLTQRELGDSLAEELRRLDPDQPYAEALAAATGQKGLSSRSAQRRHVWVDPAQEQAAEPDSPDDEGAPLHDSAEEGPLVASS